MTHADTSLLFPATDVGRLSYEAGFALQQETHARILAQRDVPGSPVGELLIVEHPPVITVSRRAGAAGHLLASADRLAELGVAVSATDRGGDITYHGPGQLVVYPILDLNRLGVGLHAYMRAMEEIVIGACARFGVRTRRDDDATGVWTEGLGGTSGAGGGSGAKVCAMGIRVRRWVSMHGLALNVSTDLSHFDLIVPCGLSGRAVTSLERELGAAPPMNEVREAVVGGFRAWARERLSRAGEADAGG